MYYYPCPARFSISPLHRSKFQTRRIPCGSLNKKETTGGMEPLAWAVPRNSFFAVWSAGNFPVAGARGQCQVASHSPPERDLIIGARCRCLDTKGLSNKGGRWYRYAAPSVKQEGPEVVVYASSPDIELAKAAADVVMRNRKFSGGSRGDKIKHREESSRNKGQSGLLCNNTRPPVADIFSGEWLL